MEPQHWPSAAPAAKSHSRRPRLSGENKVDTHIPGDATGGVLLREVTADDLPIFFEQQLDPDATRMAAFASRDRDAFISHWVRILADATIVKQTILYNGQVA